MGIPRQIRDDVHRSRGAPQRWVYHVKLGMMCTAVGAHRNDVGVPGSSNA